MEDYLKPITRKCPESLILHVGTNDLLSIQTPQQIAESIVNLADQIESDSPETLVSISAICVRKEDELWKKATEINKLLKRFCSNRRWGFLPHINIDSSCLNASGLHLNRKGVSILSSNFLTHIDNIWISSACEVQCESRIDDFISPILPSSRGFKLANLNVASLVKHIDELRILLADTPVDVLSINETRLDDSVKDSDVYIPGYEIIRRDRKTNGRFGGGVCFFVRSNISYSLRSDLSIHQLENLCIEIRKPRSKPFLVVTWYRPPDSSVEIFSYFESLIGKIDAENVEFYVLGDLNCNLAAPQLDHNANLLSSIADVYSLQQLITDPTRCTESSSTLIDLVFTNRPDRIVCSGVSHIGISDHSLIYAYRKLSIDLPSRGHTTVTYRKFKNFNLSNFRRDIAHQNWQIIGNYDNPNDMWEAWKKLFLRCVDKHAPLRNKRVRPCKSPWITSQLKKRLHARDILKLKATRSGNAEDWR